MIRGLRLFYLPTAKPKAQHSMSLLFSFYDVSQEAAPHQGGDKHKGDKKTLAPNTSENRNSSQLKNV